MVCRIFISFALILVAELLYAQSESDSIKPDLELLDAQDIIFHQKDNPLRIISTGKMLKNQDDLPFTTYIISRDEILNNQYFSLIDVLNSLPGIRTSQPGNGELGESFQIWGLTGNLYAKILINGVPVKPSVVAGIPLGNQLPVRQAEKIEIVYGNSSSVYGADAVSGVINIITKKADDRAFVHGDLSMGQGGFLYTNFFMGGKAGKNNNILQYSFYGSKSEFPRMNVGKADEDVYNPLSYYQQNGELFEYDDKLYEPLELTEDLLLSKGVDPNIFIQNYYGDNYAGSLTRPEIEDLGSASHMLGVQLDFRGVGFAYNNMYRRTHSSLGLSPVFYRYNNPQNYWGETIQQLTLGYSNDFKVFSSSTQVNYLVYNMDNHSSQSLTFLDEVQNVYRYSASNDLQFEQLFSTSPGERLEIVTGFSYKHSGNLPVTNYLLNPFDRKQYMAFNELVVAEGVLQNNRFGLNPIQFSNTSAFLRAYLIAGRFRILGGIRHDWNSLYGNQLSPQISILHKTGKNTSFRISTGTSYKSPPSSIAFQSLAHPADHSGIYYQVVPNKNLKPENFNNLEFGFQALILRRTHVEQTFFLYQIQDHIVPKTISTGRPGILNAVNDSVRTWVNNKNAVSNLYGSQTTFRITDLVKSIELDAELSLTFMGRNDRIPDVREIVAEYFKLTPKHTGKLKISARPVENLYFSIESHWMTKWLRVLIPFEEVYNELFEDTDGYYSVNFLLNYQLSSNLTSFMKITNLFDEKYGSLNASFIDENLIYNPQLRRNIRFGLSYNL
jgi:hemoglobin/transferrin/lactoferrin receptor protein